MNKVKYYYDTKTLAYKKIELSKAQIIKRNEYERQNTPDLVIIDEAFLSSAVSNMPSVSVDDVIRHVRLDEVLNLIRKMVL